MYPFSFEAVFYDEDDDEYRLEAGMSLAENYAQAAQKVEDYYGNTLMIIKNLELYEESDIITLPTSVIAEYRSRRCEDASVKCNENGYEYASLNTRGD